MIRFSFHTTMTSRLAVVAAAAAAADDDDDDDNDDVSCHVTLFANTTLL